MGFLNMGKKAARRQARALEEQSRRQAQNDAFAAQAAAQARSQTIAQDQAAQAAAELLARPQQQAQVALGEDVPAAEIGEDGRRRTARSSFRSAPRSSGIAI